MNLNSIQKGLKVIGTFSAGMLAESATGIPGIGLIGKPVMHVLGELFQYFGIEMTAQISHDLLARMGKNPHQLNHHLQKLFSDSVQEAVKMGIVESYELNDQHRKLSKEQKKALQRLSEEFDVAFDMASNHPLISADLIAFLDEDQQKYSYGKLFADRMIPEYRPDQFFQTTVFPKEFEEYFRNALMNIIRIFFIEGLKSKEHEKARVAYEQMMAEETFKGLNEIKKEIASLKTSNGLAQSRYAAVPEKAFTETVDKIGSPEQLRLPFSKAMRQYFHQFDQKLDELLVLEKDTNTRVRHIGVKAERIEKGVKKGLVLSYLLVIIAICGIAWAYIHFTKKTFNTTIEVRDEHNAPLIAGAVSVSYGIKKERSHIGPDGIAMITQIPASFEDKAVEILLMDDLAKKYILDSGSRQIVLRPDEIIQVRVSTRPIVQDKPEEKQPPIQPIVAGEASTQQIQDTKKNTRQAPLTDVPRKEDNAAIVALNGATYSQTTSEDHLSLARINASTFSFQGKAGMYPIFGKMKLNGKTLLVTDGNVTGSLNLLNDNSKLQGTLVVKAPNAERPLDLTRD